MSSRDWITFILSASGLLALQILVLNNLNLNQYMYPQVYIIALMTLPINVKHWLSYLIAFALGFVVDTFSYTPGLHSFAAVFVMFLRYSYFNSFVDKEWLSTGIRPEFGNTETVWLLAYTGLFAFVFHFVLLVLEEFSFNHFGSTLLKIGYSTLLAILLILLLLFTTSRQSTNDS